MFVLDQDTSECLHYEPVTGYPPKNIARIPRDILESHPNIEIRNDLLDCSIDICALEASRHCSTSSYALPTDSPGTVVIPG